MSAPSQDPNGSPNRLLVAIVAPFYIAWVVLRAAISAIARGLDATWSAVLRGMSRVLRPIRSVLGLIGRALATVGRAFAWVLGPVDRAIDRAIRMIRSGLVAAWGELAALLRNVGRIVAPALRAVGRALDIVLRGIGGLVRAFGVGVATIAGWSWRVLRPFVTAVGRGLGVVLDAFAAVARVVATVGQAIGSVFAGVASAISGAAAVLGRRVATASRAVGRAIASVFAAVAVVIAPVARMAASAARSIGSAILVVARHVRAALAAVRAVLVEAMRPVRARLRAATMEVRMALVAVGFERARPASPTVELRPGPNMAHPSRSPQAPPHRSSQAHPGPIDGPGRSIEHVSARSRRGSAVVAIALASGVIVLFFGALYDLLHLADPAWSLVYVVVGCAIAGLVTAPERRDEGWFGFALGMVLAVVAGSVIAVATGGSESNPVSAVVGLWIIGPIGFVPGWAVGARRHRRRGDDRPVGSVPGRPVPR